ncbi:DUF1997 domain-containing protein [Oxynema sp. CENA135]|jgi:hypothetical protein|uniref:DUF1997 domain-containing protein n=1 Tax=Oxynema sp. CENA135 TaxID=984206 RepID=UPI000F1905BC|nr:DUF1997 domain-containing protein [Oxynema sp. CENA135]MBK4728615.1 DUF1997 domain-containing protein [Oxynema sp. CENA135]RMH74836.1 MAG: DUF1997 domain-containing protein [Cyanobacteria bacterium J007]
MYYTFIASQSLQLAVPEQPVPIQHYLSEPQRIVRAIADPKRIQSLETDAYRLTMRPLKFFSLKIEPTVDLKIWSDREGTIHLKSVGCELRGIETINEHFKLNLYGTMQPRQLVDRSYLRGGAELSLKIFLPPPFSLMPKAIVQSTGNRLLGNVLLKMKQGLMEQLLLDYGVWARETAKPSIAA